MKRNDRENRGFHAPGTVALIGIFFVWFVALYFANWVLLTEAMPIR